MHNITLCMRTWCEVRNFAWLWSWSFWGRAEGGVELESVFEWVVTLFIIDDYCRLFFPRHVI